MARLLTRAPAPLDESDSDSDSDSDSSADDDAQLAADVASAYLLSDAHVAQLERAIFTGRLASYRATYLATVQTLNASSVVSRDSGSGASESTALSAWEPDDDVVDACERDAQSSAQSIAQTYQRDLTRVAVAYLATYRREHDGDMRGASRALASHLHTWANARASSKATQVAQHETSDAGTLGVQDATSDALDGMLLDDMGDIIDTSQYIVMVMPEESSSDFCANYAGCVFSFDDAPSLDFPAHVGCIHYVVVAPLVDDAEPVD